MRSATARASWMSWPGAAGALAVGRGAMVVELQRHADHVIALGLEQRRGHRGIDAAGHGDDDAGVLRAAVEVEAVGHAAPYYRWRACARNDARFATELRPHPARQILPAERSRRCRALLRRGPAFHQDIAATADFPDARLAWRLQITGGEFREFDPCRTLRPMPMPTPSATRMRMRAPTARPSTPRPRRSRNCWRTSAAADQSAPPQAGELAAALLPPQAEGDSKSANPQADPANATLSAPHAEIKAPPAADAAIAALVNAPVNRLTVQPDAKPAQTDASSGVKPTDGEKAEIKTDEASAQIVQAAPVPDAPPPQPAAVAAVLAPAPAGDAPSPSAQPAPDANIANAPPPSAQPAPAVIIADAPKLAAAAPLAATFAAPKLAPPKLAPNKAADGAASPDADAAPAARGQREDRGCRAGRPRACGQARRPRPRRKRARDSPRCSRPPTHRPPRNARITPPPS